MLRFTFILSLLSFDCDDVMLDTDLTHQDMTDREYYNIILWFLMPGRSAL